MTTLKATIMKDKMRANKTWNVLIRLTHNRRIRYIPTTMDVTKHDLTASYKIKNASIIDRCDDIVRTYRKRLLELNLEFHEMPIDSILKYITRKNSSNDVSFTEYFYIWQEQHNKLKGINNYNTALHSLQRYVGREDIMCSEFTLKFMQDFERSLADKPRAQSLYTNCITRIYNDARDYYNDDDNDIIIVKNSIRKYNAPRQNVAIKRALTVEQIRAIFDLPYDNMKYNGNASLHDMALDCFRLSFCLMGMNSVDLYTATDYDGTYIRYERTKTKDRRVDHAYIEVAVDERIRGILDKHIGKARVFDFYTRYNSFRNFNKFLNRGLKKVGNEIGVDGLQFYSARHSMATIAVNDVGISKYVVNDMLNHTDESLKVTELYIKKDYRIINEANKELLDYVFSTLNKC